MNGKFAVFLADKDGRSWKRDPHPGLALGKRDLAAFAASNSAIAIGNGLYTRAFATGGTSGSFFFSRPFMPNEEKTGLLEKAMRKEPPWKSSQIPVGAGSDSSGTFAVAYRYPVTIGVCAECTFNDNSIFVAVGGDYKNPGDSVKTAAWSSDGGETWVAAKTPPHGYRSAVQWSDTLKAWIAVGTNGSDIISRRRQNLASARRRQLECAVVAVCRRSKRADRQAQRGGSSEAMSAQPAADCFRPKAETIRHTPIRSLFALLPQSEQGSDRLLRFASANPKYEMLPLLQRIHPTKHDRIGTTG